MEKGVNTIMSEQVNHPEHYQTGKYECIEVMREIFTSEQLEGFCIGNAFKYLWRANNKEGFYTNIAKAAWYLNYLLEYNKEHDND